MNRRQFLTTLGFAAASLGACAAPARPEAPADPPPRERTLTIGSVEEPVTLNPCTATKFTSAKIAWGVMDGLLAFDESLKLQPGLAESHAVSEDGLTYTFKLRRGVTWHDGAPFSAADVVATWQAMMDPAVGAFDPEGDGQERNEEAPLAVDGRPTTFWRTEHYSSFFKSGVGLVLDMGRPARVERVLVDSPTTGASAQIQLGDSPQGPFRAVTPSRPLTTRTSFAVPRRTGRYVVVWVVGMPQDSAAEVAEVRVRART